MTELQNQRPINIKSKILAALKVSAVFAGATFISGIIPGITGKSVGAIFRVSNETVSGFAPIGMQTLIVSIPLFVIAFVIVLICFAFFRSAKWLKYFERALMALGAVLGFWLLHGDWS